MSNYASCFCICIPLQSPSLQNTSISKLPVQLNKSGKTNCEFWNIKSKILENHTWLHVSTRNKNQEKIKLKTIGSGAFCVSERSAPDETFLTNLTVPHLTSWFYQVRTRCSSFCLDMILDFDPFWKHPLLFDVKSCGRHRHPVSSPGLPGCYSLASRAVHSPLRKCFSAQNGDANLHVSVKLSHSLRRFKHPH